MGAPKNNQFWRQRTKHGRGKLFESPEMLWDACCEYFQWCDDNPLIEIDYKGKDADEVRYPRMRAYTLRDLYRYLDVNEQYLIHFEKNLKPKDSEEDKDFVNIITRVRDIVYTQKFQGAAAGFLNANIIARDLGLSDKKESTVKLDQRLFPDVSEDNSDK